MITYVQQHAKAVRGALLAGLLALYTALADHGITGMEWVGVGLAVLGVGGVVHQTNNKPKD